MAIRHHILMKAHRVLGNCLAPKSVHSAKTPFSSKVLTTSVSSFAGIRVRPRLLKALTQSQSYSSTPASQAVTKANIETPELRSRATPVEHGEGHIKNTNTAPGINATGTENSTANDANHTCGELKITASKSQIYDTVKNHEAAPDSNIPPNTTLNSTNQTLDRLNPQSLERTELFTRLKQTLEELELQQAVNEKKIATHKHPSSATTSLSPSPSTEIKLLQENNVLLRQSIEVLKKTTHILVEQNQALYGTLEGDVKDIEKSLESPRSFDLGANSGYIIGFTFLLATILRG